jgi:fumarylpyruvate hydrolase
VNDSAASIADYLFPPVVQPVVPVSGSAKLYPVHRIFCVGRNYAEHAKEMGAEVDREAPFYFMKPATAIVVSPAAIPYALATKNLHYEMELVVALGGPAFNIPAAHALDIVFGYACGLDMTRRDLQRAAGAKGRPWDTGKAFEQSAIISPIVGKETFGAIGEQTITLELNGALAISSGACLRSSRTSRPSTISDRATSSSPERRRELALSSPGTICAAESKVLSTSI